MAVIGQAPGDVERGDRVLVSVQPPALAVAQAGSVASDQPDEFMDGGEFLWAQHYSAPSSSVVLVLSSSEVMSSAQASQPLGRGHVWNGKEPSGRCETGVPQFVHLIVSPVLSLISFALHGPTPCKVWGFFLFLHMGP